MKLLQFHILAPMEIPHHLKKLYRHWPDHTAHPPSSPLSTNPLLINIVTFATTRQRIWESRQFGQTPPYTSDPILQQYRFCNIYRELDRQTIAIHSSLSPISDFPTWLLNVAFHRFVCQPDTIARTGLLSLDPKHNLQVIAHLTNHSRPKYGTAYVFPISAIQTSKYPTREQFFCLYLPQVIPTIAKTISSFRKQSVQTALNQILPLFGFNLKFHWTEILIDVAYQYPELIDLYALFPVGPGATPVFSRLEIPDLNQLILTDFPYLTYNNHPVYLSAENWEGLCCEFRKYLN